MGKHGKELSDNTKKDIIKLIESGHRASQVAQSLKISKSTISRLLKRWRMCGDAENIPRTPGLVKRHLVGIFCGYPPVGTRDTAADEML